MTEVDFDIVPVLIIGIVVLLCVQIYEWYKKLARRSHHEIYFVMMDDQACCNPYENPGSSDNCRKYCSGKLLVKLMDRINSSKSSMCIAMYNFSNHRIADCILRAHRRGIKVRLIVDKSCENKENKSQAKRLKTAGVSVRLSGEEDKLMHHKFCLIDGTASRGVLITGSLNWTYGGLSKNCENIAFIKDERVKQRYLEAFDHIWNKYSSPYHPRQEN